MSILPPHQLTNAPGTDLASRFAGKLLNDLGASVVPERGPCTHPARRWAESGLMVLTGERTGKPELCPVPLPDCADGTLSALRAVTGQRLLDGIGGAQLLTERAAITGYQRNGSMSLQGHCRLLPSADGQIGLNLAREDDWASLPALLNREGTFNWSSVAAAVGKKTTRDLLTQGRLLGLAIADATCSPSAPEPWFGITHCTNKVSRRQHPRPRVVDLSSLWAGPLCSHLWQLAGAEVIKVESSQRPDGARNGSPDFFELLNRDKECISLELNTVAGQRELQALIQQSDIVLEASRPRALRQMGIVAEAILDRCPGLTWISITGYGRTEPDDNRVAFGDDAGIAAGLSAILHNCTSEWLVCGDAIADPLAGLHAALAGWSSWLAGGGNLIDISLEKVIQHCVTATAPDGNDYRKRYQEWHDYLTENRIVAQPPAGRKRVT